MCTNLFVQFLAFYLPAIYGVPGQIWLKFTVRDKKNVEPIQLNILWYKALIIKYPSNNVSNKSSTKVINI